MREAVDKKKKKNRTTLAFRNSGANVQRTTITNLVGIGVAQSITRHKTRTLLGEKNRFGATRILHKRERRVISSAVRRCAQSTASTSAHPVKRMRSPRLPRARVRIPTGLGQEAKETRIRSEQWSAASDRIGSACRIGTETAPRRQEGRRWEKADARPP